MRNTSSHQGAPDTNLSNYPVGVRENEIFDKLKDAAVNNGLVLSDGHFRPIQGLKDSTLVRALDIPCSDLEIVSDPKGRLLHEIEDLLRQKKVNIFRDEIIDFIKEVVSKPSSPMNSDRENLLNYFIRNVLNQNTLSTAIYEQYVKIMFTYFLEQRPDLNPDSEESTMNMIEEGNILKEDLIKLNNLRRFGRLKLEKDVINYSPSEIARLVLENSRE